MKNNNYFKTLLEFAYDDIEFATHHHVMHTSISSRDDKYLILANGKRVIDFLSCSYLGIDTHPLVIQEATNAVKKWGVHLCCARSRLSLDINIELESKLSILFGANAVTFPSVSAAHQSVLPMLAAGIFFSQGHLNKVQFIFDNFAHSSMQCLRSQLSKNASIFTLEHNNIHELEKYIINGIADNMLTIYLADGVYSMGGLSPLTEINQLLEKYHNHFVLYIDDAHGTSIFGEQGEGYVMNFYNSKLPNNVIVAFSLAKGFGCNGGGILLPTKNQEKYVRYFGQTYNFSAPLDFSIIAAALATVDLHINGFVKKQQNVLRKNVLLFDEIIFNKQNMPFSPIRMIPIGDSKEAVKIAKRLIDEGILVSATFYPVVKKDEAQLRICFSANHTENNITKLTESLIKNVASLRNINENLTAIS